VPVISSVCSRFIGVEMSSKVEIIDRRRAISAQTSGKGVHQIRLTGKQGRLIQGQTANFTGQP
jgi:hypothetical protein